MKSPTPDKFVFDGTLIDGPQIDLLAIAGLELTDADRDRLWRDLSPRDLLCECECVDEIEIDADGGFRSDVWYRYEATSEERLRVELRGLISKRLRARPS